MAKKSLIAKNKRNPKFKVREYKLCRICFRELANKGEIPGVKKSSW